MSMCLALAVTLASGATPQKRPDGPSTRRPVNRNLRWMVVLQDPPVAAVVSSRAALRRQEASAAGTRLLGKQKELRRALVGRGISVTGATHVLLNAVYVIATVDQARELATLPGVARVVRDFPAKRTLTRALPLVNGQQAWAVVGGEQNAGSGVKIGILDTGIDQTHPGFQDPSLPMPQGFPKCDQASGDCAYTSNKVIVARSYVSELEIGSEPDLSRPDDRSPRDRVGHGTAVAMIAAGETNHSPLGDITGVAPKAYLGNYKIYGSPGVNDATFHSVVTQALEDALADGMDIVVLPWEFAAATWSPTDTVPTCIDASANNGDPCDPWAGAVAAAVAKGLTVVVPAGNEGQVGLFLPTQNSIGTPGTVSGAITVGATTNSHLLFSSVKLEGDGVPQALTAVNALMGDGMRQSDPLTAPLADVTSAGDDGLLCAPLPAGSLAGKVALVERGNCTFLDKVNNAQNADARAVVLYQSDGTDTVFPPIGLAGSGIPLFFIGNSAGSQLKSFLAQNPGRDVTLNPALQENDNSSGADRVAGFSSYGPAIGTSAIKPEVVAPGADILTATQNFDPNGEMYDPSRYVVTYGTSFAVPFVAGAAAIAKQQHPGWGPVELKSAVVNTATRTHVDEYDESGTLAFSPARVVAVGAGKLDAEAAAKTTVTVSPATLSFGDLTGNTFATPPALTLVFDNYGTDAVTLNLNAGAALSVDSNSFSLQPGENKTVKVAIKGPKPAAGSYEGDVLVTGGPVTLRIPYLYLVGGQTAANLVPLVGSDFEGAAGALLWPPMSLKVIDPFGLPVANAQVVFHSISGGGSIVAANPTTDNLGIAEASTAYLGSSPGPQVFSATVQGIPDPIYFMGDARAIPTILSGGVSNAADGSVEPGLQPGSYISIYGNALADVRQTFTTGYLPPSLAGVSVSFDETYVPDPNTETGFSNTGISVAGRLHFVSPGQINVQIPWEFLGKPQAYLKVSIGNISSAVVPIKLSDANPAVFPYFETGTGLRLAAARDSANQLIGSGNPARHTGLDQDFTQLYCNGLGPVTNTPASGEQTPDSPLSWGQTKPQVTVGGKEAKVLFWGLSPESVGLYQLNLVLAADTPSGKQPVVVTVNGIQSTPTDIMVQ